MISASEQRTRTSTGRGIGRRARSATVNDGDASHGDDSQGDAALANPKSINAGHDETDAEQNNSETWRAGTQDHPSRNEAEQD